MKRLASLAMCSFCFAASPALHAQFFVYEIDSMSAAELGTLGGEQSEALDINDNGDIVGWAEQTNGNRHGFLLRNGNTVMQDVTSELGTYPAAANGINNLGWVVGQFEPPQGSGFTKAFLWIEGLPLKTLQPDFDYSRAQAINMVGRIAGVKSGPIPGNPYSPCIGLMPLQWEATYNWYTLIGCWSGQDVVRATDINNMNLVVGYDDPPGQEPMRAWKYHNNGWMEIVAKPDAPVCGMWALGVNNPGTVVGRVTICALYGGQERAFISKNGITTVLGVLTGGSVSQAREINDQSFVVGMANKLVNAGPLGDAVRDRAFIYHADFGMVALPLPPGYLTTATHCVANALNERDSEGLIRVAGRCLKGNKMRGVRWEVVVKKNLTHIPSLQL